MAKSIKVVEQTKTTSQHTYNILAIGASAWSEQQLLDTIQSIKNIAKSSDTLKLIYDQAVEGSAIPKQQLMTSAQVVEESFLQKPILVIQLTHPDWQTDLAQWVKVKNPKTGPKAQVLAYIDPKGRYQSSQASMTLSKEVIKNYFGHQGITYGEMEQSIHPLITNSDLVKELILIDRPDGINFSKPGLTQRFSSFYNDHFLKPLSLYKNKAALPETRNQGLYRFLYSTLIAVGLIYALIGAINVGISSDENRYLGQAEKVYNFYKTFGADTSVNVKSGVDPQYFNGQIFDNVIYTLGKPLGWERNFTFRHIAVSVVGWLAILFAGFIALRMAGYRVALITTLLMLLSPIFMGNVFNNHRDIPLATFTVIGVYSIVRYWDIYPKVSRKYLIYVTLALALSFASRLAGGVLLMALMGFYSLLMILKTGMLHKSFIKDLQSLRPVWLLALAVVVSYFIALLFWPYGLVAPIKHSIEVIKSSGNHPVSLYQIFESKYRLSSSMPDYYVIKYLLITIPLALWLGLALLVYAIFSKKALVERSILWLMLLAFGFPLIYSYFKLGNMYGSWRHFMFTFPFIAITAGLGWHFLVQRIPRLNASLWSIGIPLLALIHPLQYVVRNHPFEYLYYNEIMGGTRGAYGKYEWDYSLNSTKQGAEWLKTYIRKNHPKGTKLVIASNASNELTQYFKGFDDSISMAYTRYYERGSILWDYALFPNMYIHPYQLKNHIFPKADSLHFIKLDGEPLVFLYKRTNRDDYEAMQAITANDANGAVQKFNAFLRHNPRSEWGWFQLAYIYAQSNNWSQAQIYVTESFKHHPEFLPSRALQGLIYLNTNKLKEAQPIFAKLIEDKYDLNNCYKWYGMTFESEKNYKKALEQYGFALGNGNNQKDTYAKIAFCFRQLGDQTQAAKYEAMSK